jgi:hypothetical protein|nr:hypothetical protein [Pseudomonas sp. BC115LW]
MSVKTLDNWVDATRRGQPLSSPERKPITKDDSELARLRADGKVSRISAGWAASMGDAVDEWRRRQPVIEDPRI